MRHLEDSRIHRAPVVVPNVPQIGRSLLPRSGPLTIRSFARFSGVDITRIGPADWERFRAVRLASLSESPAAFGSRYADWVDAPAERWQSRLTHVPLTLLAQEATQVVGVVSGQPVGETWVELISMWVAPAARGTGVAGQLIGAVVDWAAGQDRTTYLMVRSDNARARKSYERAGFVDTGIPEGWPADEPPEHRMELRA